MYAETEHYTMNKNIKGNAGNLKLIYIDPARSLNEGEKWVQDYERIITKAIK